MSNNDGFAWREGEAPTAPLAEQSRAPSRRRKKPTHRRSTDKRREPPPPAPPRTPAEIKAQIRGLEQELAQHAPSDTTVIPEANTKRETPVDPPPERHELLDSTYFRRKWGSRGLQRHSASYDDFGLDPGLESRLKPLLNFFHSNYFRVDVDGIEHVPSHDRCLIVGNHGGGPLPIDGLMLRTIMRREHPEQRELRWLSEDFVHHLPFVGTLMSRLGAVRACQENAQRLLHNGYAVAVFPEGAKGIGKLYDKRYQLQRFGRGGYIRLCLRTGTPLVPCALLGAEDTNPALFKFERLARGFGLPFVPITPTFPLLGPLGLLPAPTKWKLRFGEPLHFDGYAPSAADDEVLVGRLSDRVRASIQSMLDDLLVRRQSVFFG